MRTALIDSRRKVSLDVILAVLTGNYQPEHVFALSQTLVLYDFYRRCVAKCDVEIEKAVALMNLSRQLRKAPMPKQSTAPSSLRR